MKAKINWKANQNPLAWFKKERYKEGVSSDVERWMFDQLYDYALWLQDKVFGNAKQETEDIFTLGNVLKATDDSGMFVVVCSREGCIEPGRFDAIVLSGSDGPVTVGCIESWNRHHDGSDLWQLSSLEEAASAK